MNAPGPTEEGFDAGFTSANAAMGENKSVRLVDRSRGSGDVTIAKTGEVAVIKPGRGSAENEIDMHFDMEMFKILTAAVQQDCVLPTQESAVTESRALAINADGQRLADRACRVLKGQVFRREIVRINGRGWRFESADGFSFGIGDTGIEVVAEDRIRWILADQGEVLFLSLDINQFTVRACRNVNDHRILQAARGHGHDGLFDRFERGGPIGG